MIATSTTAPERFTPAWRKEADAPVYLLRAGSVRERGDLEADLTAARAGRVYSFELVEAVRDGVAELMADDPELGRVTDLLDQEAELETRAIEVLEQGGDDATLTAALTAITAEMPAIDRRMLKEVRDVLAQHWPPYRDLLAQQARRAEIAPIEALRRFLVGVENVDVGFERDRFGLVTEATLAALSPLEMTAAGNRAYQLLYGGGQKRPLAPPSPSGADPATSNGDASQAAGSSAKRSGRKTRA